MGKALVIISLASIVAVVTMAAMVLTSFSHREEVQLQQEILATKTAESRNFPTTRDRNEAIDVTDESASPEESKGSGELLEAHEEEGSGPPSVAGPGAR